MKDLSVSMNPESKIKEACPPGQASFGREKDRMPFQACHFEWSEAESRNLRSTGASEQISGAKILRLASLAQDDMGSESIG